ncbi:MAG: hypothetical protein AVO35_12970 [Candidatus Aegiribacteria sp. MLS_C]|nr:MAG: hypothetical protein AVO35_12970 [Candidatus Aegiribacteria sp. MLS_C]
MAKPFRDLVAKMSPEAQKKAEERTREHLLEMEIRDIRKALDMTQIELARKLRVNQAAISKMEHQSDMFISTLRGILSAMGASLKIVSSFPEGEVLINQFEDVRTERIKTEA